MALIAFIQMFALVFVVVYALLALIRRFIPRLRRAGGRLTAAMLLLSAAAGYQQGLARVRFWADTALESIQKKEHPGGKDTGYFLGDFLPVLKMVSPVMPARYLAEVERIDRDGTPCARRLVRSFRGEPVPPELNEACMKEQ